MATKPVVGLVGRRNIDHGLQAVHKVSVTDVTFADTSRSPNEIHFPREGSIAYNGPTAGDCYVSNVEDTSLLGGFAIIAIGLACGMMTTLSSE